MRRLRPDRALSAMSLCASERIIFLTRIAPASTEKTGVAPSKEDGGSDIDVKSGLNRRELKPRPPRSGMSDRRECGTDRSSLIRGTGTLAPPFYVAQMLANLTVGVVDACCSPWQTLTGRHPPEPCLIFPLWRIRAVSNWPPPIARSSAKRFIKPTPAQVEALKKRAKHIQRNGGGKHADLLNRVARSADTRCRQCWQSRASQSARSR